MRARIDQVEREISEIVISDSQGAETFRIKYLGSKGILKSLYQNGYPISDVYTQPPQKSQRGQKINKSPIQGIAETLNLDFRTPKYLKDNK